MSQFKHQFIIYNSADYKNGTNNEDGYYTICLHDLKDMEGVEVIGGPVQKPHWLLKTIIKFFRFLRIPTKCLRCFVKQNEKDAKDLCVVFFRIFNVAHLTWLRLQYPQATFVLFLRDLYETKQPHVTNYRKDKLIDCWGSFDLGEKEKYGLDFYYPEIESKIDLSAFADTITCDVFFAGKAKDRYQQLLKIYDYLDAHGVNCHFIIMDVDEQEKEVRDGIEYTSELIPYKEMLIHSVRCHCLLDINQNGAVGNTSRFLEAIMYNKRLLTNNLAAKESEFYKPEYMMVFEDITEVDPVFILQDIQVDYQYHNEFSPIGLLETIDNLIPIGL